MTAPARVIIADDEPLARRRMLALLAPHDADFAVVAECGDGEATLAAMRDERPDVIFLDIEMPAVNGLELLRTADFGLPLVVFVTAHERYAVEAFDAHAVDYLLKPCDEARFARALDRVREQLVVARSRAPRRLAVGDIEIDIAARHAWRAGKQVVLRRREFDVLVRLVQCAGQVVARNELLHDVWGYQNDVVSRTVDTHVFELRRKLGHAPSEVGFIETIARVGYRMRIGS